MKTSLEHLPQKKQSEIKVVRNLICELIDAEFVILFGSYARGDWVEDITVGKDNNVYEYKSDYDILVVVKDLPKYQYRGYRKKIKNKARKEKCQTRLSIIIHSLEEFNREIENGSYFFVDIKKEGILLYSSERFDIPEEKELSIKERRLKAEKHFNN